MSASIVIWKQFQLVLSTLSKCCLLKVLVTLCFCEHWKPIKMSAAVKGDDFILPSPGHLFCLCSLPYGHTSIWAVNQTWVKTKPGRKWQIWGETASLVQGQLLQAKCICGVCVAASTLCCQLGGEFCHESPNP